MDIVNCNNKWLFICPLCSGLLIKEKPHIDNFHDRGDFRTQYELRERTFVREITNHLLSKHDNEQKQEIKKDISYNQGRLNP